MSVASAAGREDFSEQGGVPGIRIPAEPARSSELSKLYLSAQRNVEGPWRSPVRGYQLRRHRVLWTVWTGEWRDAGDCDSNHGKADGAALPDSPSADAAEQSGVLRGEVCGYVQR